MEELQKKLLEQKLHEQQKQSEEDAKWLQAEEQNMVGIAVSKPHRHFEHHLSQSDTHF